MTMTTPNVTPLSSPVNSKGSQEKTTGVTTRVSQHNKGGASGAKSQNKLGSSRRSFVVAISGSGKTTFLSSQNLSHHCDGDDFEEVCHFYNLWRQNLVEEPEQEFCNLLMHLKTDKTIWLHANAPVLVLLQTMADCVLWLPPDSTLYRNWRSRALDPSQIQRVEGDLLEYHTYLEIGLIVCPVVQTAVEALEAINSMRLDSLMVSTPKKTYGGKTGEQIAEEISRLMEEEQVQDTTNPAHQREIERQLRFWNAGLEKLGEPKTSPHKHREEKKPEKEKEEDSHEDKPLTMADECEKLLIDQTEAFGGEMVDDRQLTAIVHHDYPSRPDEGSSPGFSGWLARRKFYDGEFVYVVVSDIVEKIAEEIRPFILRPFTPTSLVCDALSASGSTLSWAKNSVKSGGMNYEPRSDVGVNYLCVYARCAILLAHEQVLMTRSSLNLSCLSQQLADNQWGVVETPVLQQLSVWDRLLRPVVTIGCLVGIAEALALLSVGHLAVLAVATGITAKSITNLNWPPLFQKLWDEWGPEISAHKPKYLTGNKTLHIPNNYDRLVMAVDSHVPILPSPDFSHQPQVDSTQSTTPIPCPQVPHGSQNNSKVERGSVVRKNSLHLTSDQSPSVAQFPHSSSTIVSLVQDTMKCGQSCPESSESEVKKSANDWHPLTTLCEECGKLLHHTNSSALTEQDGLCAQCLSLRGSSTSQPPISESLRQQSDFFGFTGGPVDQ